MSSSPYAHSRAGREIEHRNFVADTVGEWVPAVIHVTVSALQSAALRNAVMADRTHLLEVLAVIQARSAEFSAVLVREVSQEVLGTSRTPFATAQAPQRLELTLLDADSIDEQIEVARIVQGIESRAEWDLSQLAALCSRLAGRDTISIDTNPLQPAAVARGMRRALQGFNLSQQARLFLLRELGAAAGARLREVYSAHARRLKGLGVQPLDFVVRTNVAAERPGARARTQRPRDSGAGVRSAAADPATPATSNQKALAHLVQWARQTSQATRPSGETQTLDGPTAVRVMERLLATLGSQPSLSARGRDLLHLLDTPARRIAAHDRNLWRSLEHPWWQLLDRVVSAGSVQDDVEPAGHDSSLDRVVERLAESSRPDAMQCQAALAQVDFIVTGLLDERRSALDIEATALQRKLDRNAVEHHVREQIVDQLRSTPAPARLRQFLLGPWAIVLADAAVKHGEDSAELQRLSKLVDALIAAACKARESADPTHTAELIEHARNALSAAQFPNSRIEAELTDLASELQNPGPLGNASEALPQQAASSAALLSLHDGLPTVPIDTVECEPDSPAKKEHQHWLDGLEPGDYCRLFILERWMTTQLTWRSRNRSTFVFSSRHAGRLHSLTRRALERLRAAGLATTIEHGQLVAQAMDTLTGVSGWAEDWRADQ